MLARPLVFLWLLLASLPAAASLDARAPVVTLWSLPIGFAAGVASLLVRPSRRWLFLAVPVALGALVIAEDSGVFESTTPPLEVIAALGLLATILLIQAGAGFLIALLAKLSLKAIGGTGLAGRSKSGRPLAPDKHQQAVASKRPSSDA
jgi:hypothetical protein